MSAKKKSESKGAKPKAASPKPAPELKPEPKVDPPPPPRPEPKPEPPKPPPIPEIRKTLRRWAEQKAKGGTAVGAAIKFNMVMDRSMTEREFDDLIKRYLESKSF